MAISELEVNFVQDAEFASAKRKCSQRVARNITLDFGIAPIVSATHKSEFGNVLSEQIRTIPETKSVVSRLG